MTDIFVGKKETFVYVLRALSELEENDKVVIKARGRMISKAVDIAELTKRQKKGLQEDIKIYSEKIDGRNVSIIEIELRK